MGASVDMGTSAGGEDLGGHLEDGLEGGVGVLGSFSVDHVLPASSSSSSSTEGVGGAGGVGGIPRIRPGRRASNARASTGEEEEGHDHDQAVVTLRQSPASSSAAKRESRARRIEVGNAINKSNQ